MGQLSILSVMQNGVLLPSSLRIGQLATPIHLVLCTQQAEIVPCYIEIQQDSPTKKLKVLSVTQGLTLYTSTAITVHSLIDHCLHSFDLQSGNWEIFAMNKKLDRFMYVGEVKKAFKPSFAFVFNSQILICRIIFNFCRDIKIWHRNVGTSKFISEWSVVHVSITLVSRSFGSY